MLPSYTTACQVPFTRPSLLTTNRKELNELVSSTCAVELCRSVSQSLKKCKIGTLYLANLILAKRQEL